MNTCKDYKHLTTQLIAVNHHHFHGFKSTSKQTSDSSNKSGLELDCLVQVRSVCLKQCGFLKLHPCDKHLQVFLKYPSSHKLQVICQCFLEEPGINLVSFLFLQKQVVIVICSWKGNLEFFPARADQSQILKAYDGNFFLMHIVSSWEPGWSPAVPLQLSLTPKQAKILTAGVTVSCAEWQRAARVLLPGLRTACGKRPGPQAVGVRPAVVLPPGDSSPCKERCLCSANLEMALI